MADNNEFEDSEKSPEPPPEKGSDGFWSKISSSAKFILKVVGLLLVSVAFVWFGISAGVVFGILMAVSFIFFLIKKLNPLQDDKNDNEINENEENKENKEETASFGAPQDRSKKTLRNVPDSVEIINSEDIEVSFEDIAGNEEAKHEVEQVIKFFKKNKQLAKFGGKVPKGVLLYGPPGTGKTMMAKAVAKELGRPFIMPISSSFAEIWVGTGPKRVRELFETAKLNAPCVVFIDEIDALGKRSQSQSGGDTEHNNTLNEVLKQLDGFATSADVVVFAATNFIENLDPALTRPGRLDRHIKIDNPDIIAREAIFEVHMKKKSRLAGIKYKDMFSEDVNLKSLARRTYGCSGADIENIVNETCIAAGEADADKVTMQYFIESIDRVMTGTKRRNLLSDDERERVAYHESGHALTGYFLPEAYNPNHITIVGRDKSLGHTMAAPEKDKQLFPRKDLIARIAVMVGGRTAEKIKYPGTISTGGADDYEKANDLAEAMVIKYGMAENEKLQRRIFRSSGNNTESFKWSNEVKLQIEEEIDKILESAEDLAYKTLKDNWEVVGVFTEHLLEVETMDEDEINKVIKKALKEPVINKVRNILPTKTKQ